MSGSRGVRVCPRMRAGKGTRSHGIVTLCVGRFPSLNRKWGMIVRKALFDHSSSTEPVPHYACVHVFVRA